MHEFLSRVVFITLCCILAACAPLDKKQNTSQKKETFQSKTENPVQKKKTPKRKPGVYRSKESKPVGEKRILAAGEVDQLLRRIEAIVQPFILRELADESKEYSDSMGFGRLMQMAGSKEWEKDGTLMSTTVIKTLIQGASGQSSLAIYHKQGKKPHFVLRSSNKELELKLRLVWPNPAAIPIGFTEVAIPEKDLFTVFRFEEGKWTYQSYGNYKIKLSL
jgi:hypothetical protein